MHFTWYLILFSGINQYTNCNPYRCTNNCKGNNWCLARFLLLSYFRG